MPRFASRRVGAWQSALAFILSAFAAASFPELVMAQKAADVPGLLRDIHKDVREIGKRPGEDFFRGEFFLGEGDDDTYKTHHVGILIRDEAEGPLMTIEVTRLEPSKDNPRVKYARDPRSVVCRLRESRVEVLRSDYSSADLGTLLTDVLRAVVDKKNLLKR